MRIQGLHCPSCNAALSVDEASTYVKCTYCGVTSFLEHSEGTSSLKLIGEIQNIIESSEEQTQHLIESTSRASNLELQRAQLSSQLSAAKLSLMMVESEIRQLEREGLTGKSRRQHSDLLRQGEDLRSQIFELERQLNPNAPAAATKPLGQRWKPIHLVIAAVMLMILCGICSFLLFPSEADDSGVIQTTVSASRENEGTEDSSEPETEPTAVNDPATPSPATSAPATEGEGATSFSANDEAETLRTAQATARVNANVRAGPGTSFDIVEVVTAGQQLTVYGRSTDGWLTIDEDGKEWIGSSMVELDVTLESIPLMDN